MLKHETVDVNVNLNIIVKLKLHGQTWNNRGILNSCEKFESSHPTGQM